MKNKILTLVAVIATSQNSNLAFADSSNTTLAIPSSSSSAPSANENVTTVKSPIDNMHVTYVGYYFGPGFSSDNAGEIPGGGSQWIQNRLSVKYNINEDTLTGVQARVKTTFNPNGLAAENDAWRVYADFKKVAGNETVNLEIIPRAILPTTKSAHNQSMVPSPELIPILNINPKDSRFTFSVYPDLIKYVYSNEATAILNNGTDFQIANSFEGTYTLTSKSQITFGYYPDFKTTKTAAMANYSNEVDLGVSFDVAKGWALNPYVSSEFLGMGANGASPTKNMAINLLVSGTFL